MSTPKFAVQTGALTGTIYAGSVDESGSFFTDQEDVTGMVFQAVADWVKHHHNGHAYVDLPNGVHLDIDVTKKEVDSDE